MTAATVRAGGQACSRPVMDQAGGGSPPVARSCPAVWGAAAPAGSPGLRPGPALALYLASYRPGGFAPSAAQLAAATILLPVLEQALVPLPEPALRTYLYDLAEMLNAGVANPLPGTALGLRCMALVAACAPLPAVVWDSATTREALAHFRFFPSAAELVAFLAARAAPHHGTAVRLRLMLAEARHRTRA